MISKVSLVVLGLALVLSAEAFGFGVGGQEGGQEGQEGQSSGGHGHAHGHQQGGQGGEESQNGQQGGRHHHAGNRGGRGGQGGQGRSGRGHRGHRGHRGGFDLSKYVKFQNCDSTAQIQIQNFNITMRSVSGRLVSSSNISNNLFFNLGVSVDQPQFSLQLIKDLPLASFPLAQQFLNLNNLDQTFDIPTMALHPMGPMMFHGASSQISEDQIEQIKEQLKSMENSTVTSTFSAHDASQNTVACFQINESGALITKAMNMFEKMNQSHETQSQEDENRQGSAESEGQGEQNGPSGPAGPEGPENQGGDSEEQQQGGNAAPQLVY